MQIVQSSIGMEFVNALLEPICGTMRRKLRPLPREPKKRRQTTVQYINYLRDDDVLSESEAQKQAQKVKKEKKSMPTTDTKLETYPSTPSMSATDDENAPLKRFANFDQSKYKNDIKEEEEVDDDEEETDNKEEEKAVELKNDDNNNNEEEKKEEKVPSLDNTITYS
eukprot:291155_1